MRILSLIWRHWLVLLLSLIVSAAIAVPFAQRSAGVYSSSGQLFLPSPDPVSGLVSDASSIDLLLQDYAQQSLSQDVRDAAGAEAPQIQSVAAVQLQNEQDVYELTAKATTAPAALTAVQLSAEAMGAEADRLLETQFAQFREDITEDVLVVFREKRRVTNLIPEQQAQVDGILARLDAAEEDSAEAETLTDELASARTRLNTSQQRRFILDKEQQALVRLPAKVGEQFAVAKRASELVAGPSRPVTDKQIRVIQLVGAAMIAGLLAATLITLWLERDALRGGYSNFAYGAEGSASMRAERSPASGGNYFSAAEGEETSESSAGTLPRNRS
jgi:hypothetical protein